MKKFRFLSALILAGVFTNIVPAYAVTSGYAPTSSEIDAKITPKAQGIINTIIKPSMTTAEKVKAINNYLVMNVQYDFSFKYTNAYDALFNNKAVCKGYSDSAQKLFTLAGIQSKTVIGTMNGGSHQWNLVNIDGAWYHVDVTNNDVVVRDVYLLVSDTVMTEHGYVWDKSQYPSSLKNYYNYNVSYTDNENYDSYNTIDTLNAYKVSVGKDIIVPYTLTESKPNFNYSNGKYKDLNGNYINGFADSNGTKYYFKNGVMQKGWVLDNNKWYYFKSNGAMAIFQVIDNKYYVGANGYWVY